MSTTTPPPTTPAPIHDAMPAALKGVARWVNWKYELREQRDAAMKWTKVPYRALPLAAPVKADSTDPATWSTFELAMMTYITGAPTQKYDGVGLVLDGTDFTAIDLDHVIGDDGVLHPEADRIVKAMDSYTEVSPSGTGIRIIARGKLPEGAWMKKAKYTIAIEMYDTKRYVTVTGRHLADAATTVEERTEQLAALQAHILGVLDGGKKKKSKAKKDSKPARSPKMADEAVVQRARDNKGDGLKFIKLYDFGDMSDYKEDHSSADLALVWLLSYYTQDPEQIDRIVRQSKLYREKWDRDDYRERTITKALDDRELFYKGDDHDDDHLGDWEAEQPPTIQAGSEDFALVKNKVLARLALRNNPERGTPNVFQRDGMLVGMEFPPAKSPRIFVYDAGSMAAYLQREYVWKIGKVYIQPPSGSVSDVLSQKNYRGVATLLDVVEVPVFAPDGSVRTTPGYDAAACVYYSPAPGFSVPPVPEHPTPDDVEKAVSLFFDDLYVDFPFADEASRAHALAAVLLPFVRSFIAGPTPLHSFDAPVMGSGKTFLANFVSIISTGREAEPFSHVVGNEDEYRKRILARLLQGGGPILIDNVPQGLLVDSGALAAVLTSVTFSDRILQYTKIGTAPNRSTWMMTGNHLRLSSELASRTVMCRLSPDHERPHERPADDFKHHPILTWVADNRGALVHAALTLVRAWLDAGRPAGAASMRMSEWSQVMGGLLMVAGVPGFLGNYRAVFDEQDATLDPWRVFFAAWAEQGGKPTTAADLDPLALQHLAEPLSDARRRYGSELDFAGRVHRLGRALSTMEGRPIEGADGVTRRIEAAGRLHGHRRWELKAVHSRKRK